MSTYSSYSKEEIAEFIKNQPTQDEMRSGNKIKYWGMAVGYEHIWIPLEKLKLDHLRNIIKYIKGNPLYYTATTKEAMEAEYKRRYDNASEAEKILYG